MFPVVKEPQSSANTSRLQNAFAARHSLLMAEAPTYSRFSSSEQRRVDMGVDPLADVPSARIVGVLQGAVVEVQAEGHRCTMLMIVPATKQNDPIRYSQSLMLPLDCLACSVRERGDRAEFDKMYARLHPESSRTNADDRLPPASLGRV
jgi:hypothetical protein